MQNAIGQALNVGDVVAYVTRTRPPETRLGVITRFHFETRGGTETCAPVVYSWSCWQKGGFARRLNSCDHVFPAPHVSVDDAKAKMISNKYW